MNGRPRIKREAAGIEELQQAFHEFSPDEVYEIHFVYDKTSPKSQKAVYIIDATQFPYRVGHFNLSGYPAIGPTKDFPCQFLLMQAGLANADDDQRQQFLDSHFVDGSRMKLMQDNRGFFGYGARMESPQPCSATEALVRLDRYMKQPVSEILPTLLKNSQSIR